MSGNLCRCGAYAQHRPGHPRGGRAGATVKPFRYERAGDISGAVATLVGERTGQFLAGGTNLVDLMKLDVMQPSVLVDISAPTSRTSRICPTAGCALARGDDSSRRRPESPHPLPGAVAGPALGGLRTAPEYCHDRREPPAAHPLCLLLRHDHAVQQAGAGNGLLGAGGMQQESRDPRRQRQCVATHPSDMAVAMTRAGRRGAIRGRTGEREIPITELYRLPGDEPSARHHPGARRAHYRGGACRLGFAANSYTARCASEPRTPSRWSRSPRRWRCEMAWCVTRGLPWAGWRTGPGAPGGPRMPFAAGPPSRRASAPRPKPSWTAAVPLRENGYKVPLAVNVMTRTMLGPVGGPMTTITERKAIGASSTAATDRRRSPGPPLCV